MSMFAMSSYFFFLGNTTGLGFKSKKTDYLWTETMFFRTVCPLGVCYHN